MPCDEHSIYNERIPIIRKIVDYQCVWHCCPFLFPGSYIWHGHNGVSHVDGFQGPLIVRPRAGSKPPVDQPPYDDERTVFISDWWHQLGGLMAAGLNR